MAEPLTLEQVKELRQGTPIKFKERNEGRFTEGVVVKLEASAIYINLIGQNGNVSIPYVQFSWHVFYKR